jgi:hypothetical protein
MNLCIKNNNYIIKNFINKNKQLYKSNIDQTQTLPNQPNQTQITPNRPKQIRPNQNRPNQIRPIQAQSNQIRPIQAQPNNQIDKVIIICPTYNRRNFIPSLIYQFYYQTYPQHLLSMIILDDSDNTNQDIIDNLDINIKSRILYIYDSHRKSIGAKRNLLNDIAKCLEAEYIVCFDDDDYYPPDRVLYGINMLKKNDYLIGGSSSIPIYFTKWNKTYLIDSSINKIYFGHALNGTLIYNIRYLKNNKYIDTDTKNEEKNFLKNYKVRLCQIPHKHVMLCISHSSNTVDKHKLISTNKNQYLKIDDLINDDNLLAFFKNIN